MPTDFIEISDDEASSSDTNLFPSPTRLRNDTRSISNSTQIESTRNTANINTSESLSRSKDP